MQKLKSNKLSVAAVCASIFLLAACGQNQEASQGVMGTSEGVAQERAGSGDPVTPTTGNVGAMSSIPSDPTSSPAADAMTPPGVAGTPGTAGTAANPRPAVTTGESVESRTGEAASSGETK